MPTSQAATLPNTAKDLGAAAPSNASLDLVKKSLPHLDLDTGLKNRIVKRDPITGFGVGSISSADDSGRVRASSTGRKAYNQKLISWDYETSDANGLKNPSSKRQGQKRNPIALTGELGVELDTLNCTGRPRTGAPREPQRNPISGRGDFGTREWDPIGKYNGRTRRAKSTSSVRCNPLTGENVKTYDIMIEEKKKGDQKEQSTPPAASPRNIFTGEHCETYTLSPGQKSPRNKSSASNPAGGRNVITGSNCSTYDVNAEVHTSRKRTPVRGSNPVNGENVNTFTISHEERPRSAKPYVYRNTVTGENVPSYKITPIERNVTPRALTERQNPLSGENVDTYTYRVGEGKPATKKRDLSSPLTGEGLSCRTYTISVEERSPQQNGQNSSGNGQSARIRARSSGPMRNILTGENCETYMVYKEMRSEKASSDHRKPSYNILTGTTA